MLQPAEVPFPLEPKVGDTVIVSGGDRRDSHIHGEWLVTKVGRLYFTAVPTHASAVWQRQFHLATGREKSNGHNRLIARTPAQEAWDEEVRSARDWLRDRDVTKEGYGRGWMDDGVLVLKVRAALDPLGDELLEAAK